jgi:hypothetical protein
LVDINVIEKLKILTWGYEPKNILNCDETSIFFRELLDKILCLKNNIFHKNKIA